MSDRYIEKILVLSTAHMPEQYPDTGSVRVIQGTYEWIWVLSSNLEEYRDFLAEWQIPIIEYALSQGCTYICFDAGAEYDPQFETYDW